MRSWRRGWAVCPALWIWVLVLGWAVPLSAQQPEAQGSDFYIVNNGPRGIEQVFISPTGDRNWGRDRLGRRAIAPGDGQLMRQTVPGGCQGDVRVVFDNGTQMERRNQNLCRINKMFFNSPASRGRRPETPDLTIRNAGEEPIDNIYVVPAGERSWGRDWLGQDQTLPGNGRTRLRIGTDLGCQFDIRATFHGGESVEYYNENICAEGIVIFFAPQPGGGGGSSREAERGGAVARGGGNVTVVNAYRVALRELYISPSNLRDWGQDFLPDRVFVQPNESYGVQVDLNQTCQFDIKAVWDTDAAQTLRGLNLCQGRPVTLSGPRPGEKLWTGTGFYVSHSGHVLTNKHVIRGCSSVVIARADGVNLPLAVVAEDPEHDLALLQQPGGGSPSATFRAAASPLRAGEPSISLGYPIRELLGSLIVTTGILSSLSGGRGDGSQFQMQTPIQPGNSGGPVFDEAGLVIGVSTAQLTRAGGREVQNVNFGIKAEVARQFLESQGVKVETARPGAKLTPADITEQQQKNVLPLTCYN